MAANAALLALKAQREAQQRAEEEAFRAAMMAKFAEDDRIEQLNAQKRRLKVWLVWCAAQRPAHGSRASSLSEVCSAARHPASPPVTSELQLASREAWQTDPGSVCAVLAGC